jgi:hypothetical protein
VGFSREKEVEQMAEKQEAVFRFVSEEDTVSIFQVKKIIRNTGAT